jgi:uroporphyrinogen III methyltransferase / synthase
LSSPNWFSSKSILLSDTQKFGKVYLVGAGPGDPGLLTLRGAEILAKADVILVDGLVNESLKRLIRSDAEWISVGKHGGDRIWKQTEINDAMVEHFRSGKSVVRLKGGDSGVFARSAEELQRLVQEGIHFEVVPGITAALASAAYTGIPLTHRDWSSAVALVTGQMQATDGGPEVEEPMDWDGLAKFPGTLVVYMGVTSAPVWSRSLIRAGKSPDTPVAIVRRCSWPDQQTIHCRLDEVGNHLNSGSKLRPPVLAIVGDVAALGQAYDWFSNRPLFGKTVLVARPENQAEETIRELVDLGAKVLYQKAITIKAVERKSDFDVQIKRIADFNWLIFSSTNGVDQFCQRFYELGLDGRSLGPCKLAGVGPSIADSLARWHLRCDLIPNDKASRWSAASLASDLVMQFNDAGTVKQNCLVVRADRGKKDLEEALVLAGHDVEVAIAYQSLDVTELQPEVAQAMDSGAIDVVLATSSAIAESLLKLAGGRLHSTTWIAISEEVRATIRKSGPNRVFCSAQSTVGSMQEKLMELAVHDNA